MTLSPVISIKEKLSIVDVVGSYLKLEKAGINYKARCPFHNEKTASFFVSPARDSFHCFGCGKGGDIFTFVEEIEGVEFREALRSLAQRAGITLEDAIRESGLVTKIRKVLEAATIYYCGQLEKNASAKKYLNDRGVSSNSVENFRIGFSPGSWASLHNHLKGQGYSSTDLETAGLVIRSPKGYYDRFRNRLMFPITDYAGRIVAFSGRVLPGSPEEKREGKYINSPETPLFVKSKVFYGLDKAKQAIRRANKTYLVEGQMDVVLAHQAGTDNLIGVSGTALSADHLQILKRLCDTIVLILDADEAGFKASERSARMILATGLYLSVVALPPGEDPASLATKDEQNWRNILSKELPFIEYAISSIKTLYGTDKKKLQNAVRQYLYPAIADTYNEIEKDVALQQVSVLFGVSPDSTRSDFEKWLLTRKNAGTVEGVSQDEPMNFSTSYSLDNVAAKLWGLLMYFSDSKPAEKIDVKMVREEIEKDIGKELYQLFSNRFEGDNRGEYIFKAEMYHPGGQGALEELKLLKQRLKSENLKNNFTQAMEQLKAAESKGDADETNKWLKVCQEISVKLSSV